MCSSIYPPKTAKKAKQNRKPRFLTRKQIESVIATFQQRNAKTSGFRGDLYHLTAAL